jgi:signal transduction histidine kinase
MPESIRVRTTIGAVTAVALALFIGGLGLLAVIRSNLTDQLRTTARSRAHEAATALRAGYPPTFVVVDTGEQVVQVLDSSGRVLALSPAARALPVLVVPPGQSRVVQPARADESFIAVAEAASTPQGRLVVVVARGLGDVGDSTHVVGKLLLLGLPVVLGIVGAATWAATGRALKPVERIRAEVDAISESEMHRRVPQTGGRDEIARLAGTMNRMLDRLDRARRRQRRFVSDASHELRSPVASIRQHAEVALAHPERTTVPELAETVLAEDLRVQQLVEALLLLARADEGGLDLHRRAVDVDDLVFEEADRLRANRGLRVDTSAVAAARVQGDADALRGALRNLGDNAARHARTRVAFALAQDNGSVTLTVTDDGAGIPTDERERVLDRFVRLDESRDRDAGGSGLGLAIVAEVARAHGGAVTIGDSDLGGASVEVRLPSSE